MAFTIVEWMANTATPTQDAFDLPIPNCTAVQNLPPFIKTGLLMILKPTDICIEMAAVFGKIRTVIGYLCDQLSRWSSFKPFVSFFWPEGV